MALFNECLLEKDLYVFKRFSIRIILFVFIYNIYHYIL